MSPQTIKDSLFFFLLTTAGKAAANCVCVCVCLDAAGALMSMIITLLLWLHYLPPLPFPSPIFLSLLSADLPFLANSFLLNVSTAAAAAHIVFIGLESWPVEKTKMKMNNKSRFDKWKSCSRLFSFCCLLSRSHLQHNNFERRSRSWKWGREREREHQSSRRPSELCW